MLEDAIRLVAQHQTASVSLLQRRLRVGYTRAGRLIDMLERRGIVSGYEGSKARNVLIAEGDLARILGDPPPAEPDPEPRRGHSSDLPASCARSRQCLASRLVTRRLVPPAAGDRAAGHAGALRRR